MLVCLHVFTYIHTFSNEQGVYIALGSKIYIHILYTYVEIEFGVRCEELL
jgi:hypothetical protein